jgi:hypothetical protein
MDCLFDSQTLVGALFSSGAWSDGTMGALPLLLTLLLATACAEVRVPGKDQDLLPGGEDTAVQPQLEGSAGTHGVAALTCRPHDLGVHKAQVGARSGTLRSHRRAGSLGWR